MDFQKLVLEARTCRRFVEEERLSEADLLWLVECARITPSARNAQVLRYITVSAQENVLDIFQHTLWAAALKDWKGPQEGERPTGFIVMLMPKEANKFVCFDVGIVAQTIQLAATSRGWGCCMVGSINAKEISSRLQAPENMDIALVLGLGVAKEKRVIAPMPADGSCLYWRDAEQTHFVPKRALEEILIGRY